MKNIPFHSTALSKIPVPRVESMDRKKKNATLSNTSYSSAIQRPQCFGAALPFILHGHIPRTFSCVLCTNSACASFLNIKVNIHVHEADCSSTNSITSLTSHEVHFVQSMESTTGAIYTFICVIL